MRKYRIGLMVGNKTIDYPHALRMGVQNTLEDAGHMLVAIADLIPYHTRSKAESYFRVAFEIAGRLDLDALIVPAGIITGYLTGNEALALDMLKATDPAKTLVLEREVVGYRCVTKDNVPGMHECMRHLIETCGFKRIAFISGPESSLGAHEREEVYFEEMAAHGLEVKPSMFARGLFSGDCEDVIEKIIDDNPDLEAIACACDIIAYTTYAVMRSRKLSVGKDIAVTGFDDLAKSAHVDPPLSTVHMTAYDFGCMAAREALRICEGKPQEEQLICSSFVTRSSCGERVWGGVDLFRELLARKPFPAEKIVSVLVDSTLSMASERMIIDFRRRMSDFMAGVRAAYLRHLADPTNEDVLLFSSDDLSSLFKQEYREHLSLEGFHAVAINMLEALLEISPASDISWISKQISHLHLRVARVLNDAAQDDMLAVNKREWITFHMADDALEEDGNPREAYRLILEEFKKIGVRGADLFRFAEPTRLLEMRSGRKTLALSDALVHLGYLANGEVTVAEGERQIALQDLLSFVGERIQDTSVCTVGGIMAGDELLGVAVLDSGTLNDNGQLMAFLNLGFAFKHLQNTAEDRETNKLLSQHNLLLERQSRYDDLTGLLNRRGVMESTTQFFRKNVRKWAAVYYLDLDGLKTINDTFGHDAGDDAIRATAHVLGSCVPSPGVLGRLGGDEFVACVLAEGEADESLGRNVQAAMEEFNRTHDYAFELSISYGGTRFIVEEDTYGRVAELMVAADEQLYQMKRTRHSSRRFEP